MRTKLIALALLVTLALGGVGCATLFNNAPTAAEKAEKVLSLLTNAVNGLSLVANMVGADLIATADELRAFNEAMADTKKGLVGLTAVVEQIIARHDAEKLPEAEAASADARAIP